MLASGELERFYSALSLIASSAADGVRCRALATFRALDLLLDEELLQRASEPERTPGLSWAGRDTFARSLVELRDTVLGMEQVTLYACAASVDTMSLTAADVEDRLDGVMSTPRFLREAGEGRLVFA